MNLHEGHVALEMMIYQDLIGQKMIPLSHAMNEVLIDRKEATIYLGNPPLHGMQINRAIETMRK